MAKGDSSSSPSPQPSSPLSVFIDTNLDTHLAMVLSPDDTVADLKGKIRTEHALCFPNIGEVSVHTMKVRRKASFYHLSDSMLVQSAFSGIKGTWFLHLDLVPTTPIVQSQTEAARVITSDGGGQAEKHNVLQTDHDASLLSIRGEDGNQELVMNGLLTKKGLIQTSISNVHESETLPDTLLEKPSSQGDSLLPNVSSPQTQNLIDSSKDKLVSGSKSADGSILLNIAQNDLNGSNHQQKTVQVADQGNKDQNVGVGADMDLPVVASKKEKSRKRNSSLQHDQLLDGKSKHPHVEKKKRKKEKDRSFNKPDKDQLTGHNLESDDYSKEMSQFKKVLPENSFQEKHGNNVVTLKGLTSKPYHVDSFAQQTAIEDKQKKEKRRHVSKNIEATRDEPVNNSLAKTDVAPLGKQSARQNHVEGLVNNQTDPGKELNRADIVDESTRKVLDGGSAEIGMTGSTGRLLKCTTSSTDFPIPEVSNVNSEGTLHSNATALSKEYDAADISKKTELLSSYAEVDLKVPANSGCSRKKAKIEKDTSSKHEVPSVKPVNEENIDETSENRHDKLIEVSGMAMNDADLGNKKATNSGIPPEISVKSSQHRRKKKSGKTELLNTQSNTHETVNSSRDQVPEENQKKTSSTHKKQPGKEFKGAAVPGDASAVGNSALVESRFLSSSNDRKKRRSQKKSEKIELHHQESNLLSSTHETVNSSRDKVVEEFSKETSSRHLEHPVREPKEASILGEAAGNPHTVLSIVPSNLNDKKLKRSRKQSEKIELPSGHSLVDEVLKGTKQPSKHNQNEASGSHLGHGGKEPEGASVSGDAAVVAKPATVDSTVPLNPSDKKSKRSGEKSGKTKFPGKESSKDEPIHPLVTVTTKENAGDTVNSSRTCMGGNSDSETSLREAAGILVNFQDVHRSTKTRRS